MPGNGQRTAWLRTVLDAWFTLGVGPEVLIPSSTPRLFQRERRIQAEQKGGDFYILADDDCLPDVSQEDFIPIGIDILRCHPEFAMLAPLPSNESIIEWTPENYKVGNDEEVMEHVSIGGIRFCRKGALKTYPPMDEHHAGYDGIHGDALRKAKMRVGFFHGLHFNHLGANSSTVWPE